MLLEQVGQVDLGREERRRDRAPERDHRRQPTSYDERAGRQQRPHRDQHHHQRDGGGDVAERASGAPREVQPDHGERDHRRQRQPATGGGPAGVGLLDGPRSAGSIAAVAASESATTPRNTQRQLVASATTPATVGPTIDGTTQAAAKAPKMPGWSTGA